VAGGHAEGGAGAPWVKPGARRERPVCPIGARRCGTTRMSRRRGPSPPLYGGEPGGDAGGLTYSLGRGKDERAGRALPYAAGPALKAQLQEVRDLLKRMRAAGNDRSERYKEAVGVEGQVLALRDEHR